MRKRSGHHRNKSLRVLARDGWVCVYCKSPAHTVDHVAPLSMGGTWDFDNLVACCVLCNADKRSTPLGEWLVRRGLRDTELETRIMSHVTRALMARVPTLPEAKVLRSKSQLARALREHA